jgi:hypothetical protein
MPVVSAAETLDHTQLQSKSSHTHYRTRTVLRFCEEERKNGYEQTLLELKKFLGERKSFIHPLMGQNEITSHSLYIPYLYKLLHTQVTIVSYT